MKLICDPDQKDTVVTTIGDSETYLYYVSVTEHFTIIATDNIMMTCLRNSL